MLSAEFGPYGSRLHDGQTGTRSRWIFFQREMPEAHPAMEFDSTVSPLRLTEWNGRLLRETRLLRMSRPSTRVR